MNKAERERVLGVAKTVELQATELIEKHPGIRGAAFTWTSDEGLSVCDEESRAIIMYSGTDVLAHDTAKILREIASALRVIAESSEGSK